MPRERSRPQGQGRIRRRTRAANAVARAALRDHRRGTGAYSIAGRPVGPTRASHGTTKRQVSTMYAEERPSLLPLPLEPFRYYQYGDRTVHLDGHLEINGAYYCAPPGHIGRVLPIQWDEQHVRLMDPQTKQLMREYRLQERGRYRTPIEYMPKRTPTTTLQLLAMAAHAGKNVGALCTRNSSRQRRVGRQGHPGRAIAASPARCHRRRRRLRRRAGDVRPDVPLRAPLPRPKSQAAAGAAPDRSSDPRADAVPRPHQPHDQGVSR